MKKIALKLYAHIVSFAALICGAIYFGVGVYDLVNIAVPGLMVPEQVVRDHKDNESFISSHYKSNLYEYLTEKQITTQRTASLEKVIREKQNSGIKSLFVSMTFLIVSIGIFIPHWRLVKQSGR